MGRTWRVVVAASVLAALAGCSGEGDPEPTPSATPEASATPEPTPTPTPSPTQDAGPRDLSDPELGIEFTGLPEGDLTPETITAVEAYQHFEVEFWRALTTNSLSPVLEVVATPGVRDYVRQQTAHNMGNGRVARGRIDVTITAVDADDELVTIESCVDLTGTEFVDEETGESSGGDQSAELYDVDTKVEPYGEGLWHVTSYLVEQGC